VTNLARPGGNLTGFWSFEPDMGGKWLSVLKETAENMRRVAVPFGSDTPESEDGPTQSCARARLMSASKGKATVG
jgi:putative tryptophan/tyrosine transport system substrate-binding protein